MCDHLAFSAVIDDFGFNLPSCCLFSTFHLSILFLSMSFPVFFPFVQCFRIQFHLFCWLFSHASLHIFRVVLGMNFSVYLKLILYLITCLIRVLFTFIISAIFAYFTFKCIKTRKLLFYFCFKKLKPGLRLWLSGKESACQCRRQRIHPWVRKLPHALEQPSLCATTTEPGLGSPGAATIEPTCHSYWSPHTLEPMLHKRSHLSERPEHHGKGSPHLLQLEKPYPQQQRCSTTKK